MITEREIQRLKEKVEVLTGERRGAAKQSAVRRQDLVKLTATSQRLTGSTVTVEAYNALVNDVQNIIRVLNRAGEQR